MGEVAENVWRSCGAESRALESGREIMEYLLDLETRRQTVQVGDGQGMAGLFARLARLGAQDMVLVPCWTQQSSLSEAAAAETVQVNAPGKPACATFDAAVLGQDVEGLHLAYPEQVRFSRERIHSRYLLQGTVEAGWYPDLGSPITGNVMDMGLGGILAGMSSGGLPQADEICCPGGAGLLELCREDGRSWRGRARIRHVQKFPPQEENSWSQDGARFLLLGLAFQYGDDGQVREMAEFSQGLLGSLV